VSAANGTLFGVVARTAFGLEPAPVLERLRNLGTGLARRRRAERPQPLARGVEHLERDQVVLGLVGDVQIVRPEMRGSLVSITAW
jgi:hypothetical protein